MSTTMSSDDLGFYALKQGDFQEAVNVFRRALEKKKTAGIYLGLGIAHERLEDYPTARWYLYKGLEIDPKNKNIQQKIAAVENKLSHSPKMGTAKRSSLFKVGKDYLEKWHDGRWRPVFIKGVNLGLSLPGYFPGEYQIKKGTYKKWFAQMADAGFNAVRIYNVHPPGFYEALAEHNATRKVIYLVQGIWVEFHETMHLNEPLYHAALDHDIRNAVDVVYGRARLEERPGYAHGEYRVDVSSYLIAFLYGRESESCAVKTYNDLMTHKVSDYIGTCLRIDRATPFEAWATSMCDYIQTYELQRYEHSHPVSVVTWPTLDPLVHPSEANYEDELAYQGIKITQKRCFENEDMEIFDTSKIQSIKGNGCFASYHIYPNYPDFMINDFLEDNNPYEAYLRRLKLHYGSQPVFVAEFGMSSSRNAAHWHMKGWHHGGKTEKEQGEISRLLLQSIHRSGMAGGAFFSWMDEWFKKTWVYSPYYIPSDRKPMWFSALDPEQNYGLIATHPGYPGPKVRLRGDHADWHNASILTEKSGSVPMYRFGDQYDTGRTLVRLLAQHDEGYFYLCAETAGPIHLDQASFMIGIDVTAAGAGERLLPFGVQLESPIGLTHLVHIAGRIQSRILVSSSYDRYTNEQKQMWQPSLHPQGGWIPMVYIANRRHISKDNSRVHPPHFLSLSALVHGSLERNSEEYSSRADFFVKDRMLEIRLPWHVLNVTDPSSRQVLWTEGTQKTRTTEGIRVFIISYKPEGNRRRASKTGMASNIADHLPGQLQSKSIPLYRWDGWNVPLYYHEPKQSLAIIGKALKEIPYFIKP
jgi:tetratricopeptide (TPR) repeat protein